MTEDQDVKDSQSDSGSKTFINKNKDKKAKPHRPLTKVIESHNIVILVSVHMLLLGYSIFVYILDYTAKTTPDYDRRGIYRTSFANSGA